MNDAEDRLVVLRAREEAFTDARDHLEQINEASGEILHRYFWALRVALDARADGRPMGDRDRDLEGDGAHAFAAVKGAQQAVVDMRNLLGEEIARLCGEREFVIGDKVHSATDQDLVVAAIYEPDGDKRLTEVTLSGDGEPIDKTLHSWLLDADGRPERDGLPLVRYERWWSSGLRTAGFVHPISRQIVND